MAVLAYVLRLKKERGQVHLFDMVCRLSCFLAFSFVLLCFLRGLRLYLMRAYACLMVIEIICYEHSSMCCYTSNIVFVICISFIGIPCRHRDSQLVCNPGKLN